MWGQDWQQAGCQEVGTCSTRGGSQGMYITFTSGIRQPTLALKPREDITRNPKQGYQWPQNRTYVSAPPKKFISAWDPLWALRLLVNYEMMRFSKNLTITLKWVPDIMVVHLSIVQVIAHLNLSQLLPLLTYVGKWPVAMLAIKRSAGVAQELDLRECTLYSPQQKANKAEPTLALKTQRRRHQKSKIEVRMSPRKCVYLKFFLEKTKKNIWNEFLYGLWILHSVRFVRCHLYLTLLTIHSNYPTGITQS